MFFKIIIVALAVASAHGRVLQIKNSGSQNLSVSVSGQSDIQILTGATAVVTVTEDFSGEISAVPVGSESLDIPRTKVELTLGTVQDTYDVSLVDGFNIGAKVVPRGGTNCSTAVCSADLNSICPVANQVTDTVGNVVACTNSPVVFSAVCPKAVVTAGDVTNVLTCAAQSYMILLG